MGVTSRIEVIWKPTDCSARSADSRPEPGPQTSTSRIFMPCPCALRPASSAATWAAYGVDLREPLKPLVPDDDQAMVLPCASVMVIIVLLNEAFTCATPDVMFFFSRLRTLARPAGAVVSLAIRQLSRGRAAARHAISVKYERGPAFRPSPGCVRSGFLLAGDRLGRALAGARVGVRALAANGQTLAVTQAAVAAKVHQALDVGDHFAAEIALDQVVAVDRLTDL